MSSDSDSTCDEGLFEVVDPTLPYSSVLTQNELAPAVVAMENILFDSSELETRGRKRKAGNEMKKKKARENSKKRKIILEMQRFVHCLMLNMSDAMYM